MSQVRVMKTVHVAFFKTVDYEDIIGLTLALYNFETIKLHMIVKLVVVFHARLSRPCMPIYD